MSLHHGSSARQELSLPRVFGRYLLVERLGAGGMGEIYLARHGLSGFEKLVVIKKVLPHLTANGEFLSRFIDEALVAVHLQHSNVAQVFEVGRVEDEYFLSLEYVDGSDLRATMIALVDGGRVMPPELALFVAREAASGLAYAHRRTDSAGHPLNLVHCDVSPPNLMLSFDGEVKIIDFGIARSTQRLTETNPDRGFGKFGYLAPEQLLKGGKLDPRTDVYALGVVLYEMLSGQRMFDAGERPDYRQLARKVVKGQTPLPSSVSRHLERYDSLVSRALKPDPGERFQSAAEFRDEIQRALVAVNPTLSGDHLASFLRELFPTAVERRRQLAELDKTDLEHWKREIDNQATSTVSFGLSNTGVRLPVRTGARSSAPPFVTSEVPPDAAVTINELAGDDDSSAMLALAPPPSPPLPVPPLPRDPSLQFPIVPEAERRIWPYVFAGSAVVALAVLLLVGPTRVLRLVGIGGDDPAQSAAASTTAGAPAAPAPTAAPLDAAPVEQLPPPQPIVQQLPPEPAAAADAGPAAEPSPRPTGRDQRDRSRRSRGHRSRSRADARSPSSPAAPSAAEVQARFRAARSEYQKYKARYGARLETEWNELAHLATYAQSAQKLGELDRKISQFRARMKK